MGSIAELIEQELLSWPDVSAHPHRFGGVEFHVRGHEIGHLHGDRLADLPFPVRVRRELVATGRASAHHFLPDTGWVSYFIRGMADLAGAIELFRLNYERLVGRDSALAARIHAEEE
ncbi:MAG TPA: luciferase family protein, partial [Roseiflexaceae bacterium]|nr:luciferase family protein [Roseiflexaceae bacterium]